MNLNLNELSYVAALAAEKLHPGRPEQSQRVVDLLRSRTAGTIRDGLLALQRAGWEFTATEPSEAGQ